MKCLVVVRNTNSCTVHIVFTTPTKKLAIEALKKAGLYSDYDNFNVAIFKYSHRQAAKYFCEMRGPK